MSEAVTTLATALATLCVVLVSWVAVQRAWRRSFPDAPGDEDALSGRLGCHGGCARTSCTRRCADRPDEAEEDRP